MSSLSDQPLKHQFLLLIHVSSQAHTYPSAFQCKVAFSNTATVARTSSVACPILPNYYCSCVCLWSLVQWCSCTLSHHCEVSQLDSSLFSHCSCHLDPCCIRLNIGWNSGMCDVNTSSFRFMQSALNRNLRYNHYCCGNHRCTLFNYIDVALNVGPVSSVWSIKPVCS